MRRTHPNAHVEPALLQRALQGPCRPPPPIWGRSQTPHLPNVRRRVDQGRPDRPAAPHLSGVPGGDAMNITQAPQGGHRAEIVGAVPIWNDTRAITKYIDAGVVEVCINQIGTGGGSSCLRSGAAPEAGSLTVAPTSLSATFMGARAHRTSSSTWGTTLSKVPARRTDAT